MKHVEDQLAAMGDDLSWIDVLDSVLCLLPLHISVHDADGRFLYLNWAVSEGFGLDRSAALGKTLREIEGRSADLITGVEAMFESVFTTGRQASRTFSVPVQTGLRDFEVSVTPLFSPSGDSVALALVVGTDVTATMGSNPPRHDHAGSRPVPLPRRQQEVLRLLARGRSGPEVAEELGISVRTVEAHRHEIASKLGLSTRAAIFDYAMQHGLVWHEAPD